MAEHSIGMGHCFQFHDISILAKKPRQMECLIREVIKFELHPDNNNREEGFSQSRLQRPLIHNLNE
jgi:hypothetical protein